jgi:hypothetical protein
LTVTVDNRSQEAAAADMPLTRQDISSIGASSVHHPELP